MANSTIFDKDLINPNILLYITLSKQTGLSESLLLLVIEYHEKNLWEYNNLGVYSRSNYTCESWQKYLIRYPTVRPIYWSWSWCINFLNIFDNYLLTYNIKVNRDDQQEIKKYLIAHNILNR